MRLRGIYLGIFSIGGWLCLSYIYWGLIPYNGKAWIDATKYNEFWFEVVMINLIFIISIILFILELKKELKEMREIEL